MKPGEHYEEQMTVDRENACGKYRYTDKRAALTAANYRRHDHRRKRGKTKHLRAYECPDCGGWHLSHKPLHRQR